MCLFVTSWMLSSWPNKICSSFTMILFLSMKIQYFDDCNSFPILSNDTFPMNWFFNVNGGEEEVYITILFVRGKYPIYQTCNDGFIGFELVTKDVFNKVATKVKDELERVAWHLVIELEQHFLKDEVMIALVAIYSQFMGYKHVVYSQSLNFFEGHFLYHLEGG